MKYILVPTDFSDCATFASDAAVRIAGKMGMGVHFFTRLHIHPLWDVLTDAQRKEYPESQEKIQEVEKRFAELKRSYPLAGLPLKSSYGPGEIVNNIYKMQQFQDIPLIIMGSSGASGIKEVLFGSNAQKIVKYVPCPVMIVKHPIEHPKDEFKHIIFASDFQDTAIRPFELLIDYASHFGSHIHLLHVDLNPAGEDSGTHYLNRMKKFEEMCYKLPCTLHEQGDLGVEAGIAHFAQDINADMVALAHYGMSPLKRILRRSIAESLVNHLEIPVMVLNTRENLQWEEEREEQKEHYIY